MAENGVNAPAAVPAEGRPAQPDASIADQLRQEVETEQALLDAQQRIKELEGQVESERSARESEKKSKDEASEYCPAVIIS